MLLASTAVANPQLDLTNPVGFFTNAAMAMFQQMDLHDFNGNLVTVTNIPIYEDPARFGGPNINYYTPAVHRILQLAANIYDATTNRFINGGPTNYPTVFRPMFRSQDGVVYIAGYLEVTNTQDAFNYFVDPQPFSTVDNPVRTNINMYGVPWVIGAKKGFPNFNEFSMDNSLSVVRKLQFTNSTGMGPATDPWITNQVYDLTITNSYGAEFWNSYTNMYGRPLRLVVTNEMSVVVSNQIANFISAQSRISGNDTTYASWPGWTEQISDNSFQVPLYASEVYTNGVYLNQSPFVVPLSPPQWDAITVPQLYMALQFRFRCVLIDTSVNRVIDFVNLVDQQPPVYITGLLTQGSTDMIDLNLSDQWSTKQYNGGALLGIINQIFASEGVDGTIADWRGNPLIIKQQQEQFRIWLNNGGTNNFEAPYSPRRIIDQRISLEANDPLVHYTVPDLTSTNGALVTRNSVDLNPPQTPLNNLTNLNLAYQPWGGMGTPLHGTLNPNPTFDFNVQAKDPAVEQSDDWDFPSGQSLSFEWLGRVHRGTPWQTVFLKPSNLSAALWRAWDNDNIFITNGDSVLVDAAFSLPTNDWHIASLWARWVNTNDLSTLLSINNPDTNAWAARLDGLIALTNSPSGELAPITITSNSPEAGIIAQAIQTARANTSTYGFQDVGDVLAAPELSVASPFINTNLLSTPSAGGLTDEALEKIPTQLLPLLRVDSFGQIAPANGQLELSFSGYDGHTYAIQASSNLNDWVTISTNSPSDGNFGITNSTTSGQQFYRSVLLH